MRHSWKRGLCLLSAMVLIASMAMGCASTGAEEGADSSTQEPVVSSETSLPEPAAAPSGDAEAVEFPLFDEVVEMSVFWRLNPKATASMKDYSEMRLSQELERIANVRLVYEHAPSGQEDEKFNLMRVSGDYTDLVYCEKWLNSSMVGGPAKALSDNFIIPLNDLMEQYAPNYSQLLQDDDVRRATTTDEGIQYGFALLRYNQSMKSVWGWMLREDWLENLGLDTPTTIEEFHDVLVAFRDGDPNGNGLQDEIPFTAFKDYIPNMFSPWGVDMEFVNIDGQAVYGPYSDDYREAIETWAQWYSEGLLDPEFSTNDQRQFEARLSNNLSGACYGETGGSTGLVMSSFAEAGNSDYRFVGIPMPSAGGRPGYNMAGDKLYNGVSMSISSQNPYPVESVKLLDWGYSEEGQLLWNFGVEGESYVMENGKPVFTEMITNNPDGLSIDQALARYCYGSMQGPFVFMPEVRDQRMLFYDWQRRSIDAWNQDDMSRIFPPATLSIEESERYAEIMADITTFAEESRNQFITGTKPLSEYDAYLDQLRAMGIEEATALKQASLERYYSRQ